MKVSILIKATRMAKMIGQGNKEDNRRINWNQNPKSKVKVKQSIGPSDKKRQEMKTEHRMPK